MNDPVIRTLFLAHLGSCLTMAGVIWFVQVIHYPLFAGVGRSEFPAYEQRNTALTTWVVAPLMLVEGATALLLLWFRPAAIPMWSLWAGWVLLLIVWLSTALMQVPCHEALSKAFDPDVHRRLVSTNWLRTVAWSLRAVLALWLTWPLLR